MQLTPRQRQVRDLLILGWTAKEIARSLDASPRTVEDHRYRVFKKYEVRNAVELVRKFYKIED